MGSQSENKHRGSFIAIEGTDGSGKATQVAKLKDKLEAAGYSVETIDFPQYSEESSYFVRRYLNGDYGSAESVGPFTPSLFYALDRFDAGQKIKKALDSNKVVIADRFVGSNLAHQGQKFNDNEEKLNYWRWDQKLEFEMLGTPRPSLNLILTLPPEVSLSLIESRGNKKDIHEADPEHLRRSLNAYIELSEFSPQEFVRIECARSGELMTIDEISNLIWAKIEPILPEPASLNLNKDSQAPIEETGEEDGQYCQPSGLSPGASQLYQESIDRILAINRQMRSKLIDYLSQNNQDNPEELAAQAVSKALPVSRQTWFDKLNIDKRDDESAIGKPLLNIKDDDPSEIDAELELSLVDYWPKNELSALPELIYATSNLSLADLERRLAEISYQDKSKLFEEIIKNHSASDGAGLSSINYLFDVASGIDTFLEFVSVSGAETIHQNLSPFLGYEIPEIVQKAGLDEDYRQAFKISKGLYLSLVEQGYENQAQYAVMAGNKIRWQVKLNLSQILKLKSAAKSDLSARLITDYILKLIKEFHPAVSRAIGFVSQYENIEPKQ
jgi:dTMP kinase